MRYRFNRQMIMSMTAATGVIASLAAVPASSTPEVPPAVDPGAG